MRKDDMPVVIYKILRYLYEHMRAGKTPVASELLHDSPMLQIPERYWESIIDELYINDFIKGMRRGEKVPLVFASSEPVGVTWKGYELMEGEKMQRAREFLGNDFEAHIRVLV